MSFNRSLRHHSVSVRDILPLYDGIFAVAFTLLAFNLPEKLGRMDHGLVAARAIGIYALCGLAVFIYWFKLRRLMLIDRLLQPPQLALATTAVITVALLPKLASLVLQHGVGAGNLFDWTLPQLVNTLCLGFLLLFNLTCLLYAASLRRRRGHRGRNDPLLVGVIRTQALGMVINSLLMILELSFTWFDNQYFYLLPLVLIAEELVIARQLRNARQQATATP